MLKKLTKIIFTLMFVLLFSSMVTAAGGTHINISITEKAYQNVTFAEFFWLNETVEGQIVYGYVNVTNPGQEDVSDLNVYLDNMTFLATNFTWMGGRNGSQTVYTTSVNTSQVYSNVNMTPMPLDQDLDNDNRSDFMWINRTHIIFDLSSEYNVNAYKLVTDPFRLTAGRPVVYTYDIVHSNSDVIGRVNINIPGGLSQSYVIDTVTVYKATNDYVVLHLPELRSGESALFNYTALSVIDPPINVETDYTHEQYRKVLAGECFNVTQWATNEFFYEYNLTNVNITIESLGVTWNETVFNFTLGNLSISPTHSGDAKNVTIVDNRTWYWIVGGGNMTHLVTYNISYQVCAPASVPASGSYPFIKETLQYATEGTVSGVEVKEVRAVAKLGFNFTKRIARPANTLNNTNVTWETIPKVGTSINVTFNVTKVSLWVSENLNPNNRTIHKSTYFPNQVVNLSSSQSWVAGTPWYFNYTDGSSFDSPPPIIWMYPFFHIADTENQILKNYLTTNGEDLYWKYIYVVNGYWLEIEKNVTNVNQDSYKIDVRVWNRGNGYTPQNLTVTVYDFVPSEFSAYNFSPTYTQFQGVSGPFNGTAYEWDIPPNRTPQNSSFAPAGLANSTWNLSYFANGSGDYRVSELFIVGLDPRLVDGGSSHEVIAVVSSMVTHTTEMVYVAIVLFLVGLNVMNFVVTRKKK
jgi:hypothetical protein